MPLRLTGDGVCPPSPNFVCGVDVVKTAMDNQVSPCRRARVYSDCNFAFSKRLYSCQKQGLVRASRGRWTPCCEILDLTRPARCRTHNVQASSSPKKIDIMWIGSLVRLPDWTRRRRRHLRHTIVPIYFRQFAKVMMIMLNWT